MKKQIFKMNSFFDGLMLEIAIFEPDGMVNGIVQFSHGMVEHKEYYYDFMEYLCKEGYVCIINDHRGHGNSIKSEDDYGYFYEESSDAIVEDLHQVTKYVKGLFPNKPVYLFGHSMGSLVVRKYLKKYDNDIDKLIVCGSPSINNSAESGLKFVNSVKKIKGDRYRSKLINKLVLKGDKNHKWLSNDIEYINKYKSDPKCGYVFTINGFINLIKLLIDVYSPNGWGVYKPNLPILYIAGAKDIIIKIVKKCNESIAFLNKVGYINIEKKLYPGMKHALLLEKNKDVVYKDILDFIKK